MRYLYDVSVDDENCNYINVDNSIKINNENVYIARWGIYMRKFIGNYRIINKKQMKRFCLLKNALNIYKLYVEYIRQRMVKQWRMDIMGTLLWEIKKLK